MATNKRTTPIIPNPVLIDRVLGNIQTGLMDNVDWLDVAFGRAQRIAKVIQGKRYYTPNVYAGGTEWRGDNDYIDVSPDANIGNFSFFWIDDPQTVGWVPKEQSEIKAPFSRSTQQPEYRGIEERNIDRPKWRFLAERRDDCNKPDL